MKWFNVPVNLKALLSKEHLNRKTALSVFFWFGVVGFAFSIISAIVMASLRIESFGTILTGENLFSDFLETLSYVFAENPYTGVTAGVRTIYLPFAFLVLAPYAWMCQPVIQRYFAGEVTLEYVHHEPKFVLAYFVFFFIHLALIILILAKISKFHGKELILFLVSSGLHGAILFTFGRANVLLLAFLFVLIFFWLKDSAHWWSKELAYIALAGAVAIKVYPAMFALIFIRERRFLDLIKTALYSAGLVFVPFLFIQGGFSNIPVFVNNLIMFSREGRGLGFTNISIDAFWTKIFWLIEYVSHADLTTLRLVITWVCVVAVVGACVAFSFFKKDGKNETTYLLILIGAYVLFQTISYIYVYIFFLVAHVVFFQQFDDLAYRQKMSYMICLVVIAFPYLYFWQSGPAQQIAQMVLFGFATYDMVKSIMTKRKAKEEVEPLGTK